jgi:hypothetical protein
MNKKKNNKFIKSLGVFFFVSMLSPQILCAEEKVLLSKNKTIKKIQSNEKDIVDINDNSKTDLMYKKEGNLFKEKIHRDAQISGRFHFFNSYTDEDFRKNKDDLQTLMQGDGRLNFFYEKKFENDSILYSSFEVKKKYDNAMRLKSLIGIKKEKYGDLKIASFNPIFDNFKTMYDISVGSSGAWLRNINSSFNYPENVTSGIINEVDSVVGFYTDHDLTSIMYKTPSFKGLNASVSYTNDTRFNRKAKKNFPYKNVLSLLGSFEKNLSKDAKFTISAMTELGSSYQRDLNNNGNFDDDLRLDDLRSFLVSGLVEYKKLQVIAMYANFFKTNRFEKIPVFNQNPLPENFVATNFVEPKDTYYISLAASYKFTDKFKASISQFYSENGQDYAALPPALPSTNGLSGQVKFYSTTLGASYEIYKDSFSPYVEISRFTVKDNNAIIDAKKDNTGNVFVLGAKASF